ncbi:MAG: hypothetical protein GXY55_04935, partial [Phycisphaerae bacterium]|nr:hypothetical protein [Phycisphaerae bacterium]
GGYADFDGDGWCDIEEYGLGTDPADADADGDGLSGGEESTITLTDPSQADTDGDGIPDLVPAIDIPAWSYDAWFDSHISSTWSNDGTNAIASAPQYAPWVAYSFNVSEAGIYHLAVDTSFAGTFPNPAHEIRLEVAIDGIILGQISMNHAQGLPEYTLFTPWLSAGTHRVKLMPIADYWNPQPFTIHSIVFSTVDGTDSNADGVQDWAQAILATGVDTDGDGLSDLDEAFALGTYPTSADLDRDAINDALELQRGSSPFVPSWNEGGVDGELMAERWNGIEGWSADNLGGSDRFGSDPDSIMLLSSAEYAPENLNAGDTYGLRIRGLLTAPSTGTYTFSLTGDDSAELWLSDSSSPYGRSRLLDLPLWTTLHNLEDPRTPSASVDLVAGQSYAFEILLKEHSLEEHVTLWWQVPGSSDPEIIGSQYIHSYIQPADDLDSDGLPDAWEAAHGLDPESGIGGGYADFDGDGWCDIEEYVLGTDPADADADGDGLSGGEESTITLTDPDQADTDGDGIPDLVPAIDIPAWSYDAWFDSHISSTWSNDGTNAIASAPQYAPWVAYSFNVSEAGIYHLAVDTSFAGTFPNPAHEIRLEVAIDGIILGQFSMNHAQGLPEYTLFTPWLSAGPHRVKLMPIADYWDPKPFTIHSIVFGAVDGADADGNGIQDWMERILEQGGDTDGDSISDLDEILLGTDVMNADSDGDGLSDGEELSLGSNPLDADSDGDGVDDGTEVKESRTNPLVSEFDGTVETVLTIPGAQTNAVAGEWFADETEIACRTRRGWAEYVLDFPEQDLYRLSVTAKCSDETVFVSEASYLQFYIDDVYIGSYPLVAAEGGYVDVQAFLPVMIPGEHTIRVFWENTEPMYRLRIKELQLQSLGGPDNNENGVKDWMEASVAAMSGLDEMSESYISPACIEGDARYVPFMQIVDGASSSVVVAQSAGPRWYANLPLEENGTTEATVRFQNGAFELPVAIDWIPYNLVDHNGETITLRKGDSLRILCLPEDANGGQFTIELDDETYRSPNRRPLTCVFDEAGTYTINGE